MDAYTNFAVATVATAPSPATSGTSLIVASGQGTRFPAPPFNASVWPVDALPTPANAEIVRVTDISTDTLTITRAQESTTARSILVGDLIAATITKQTLDDLLAAAGGITPPPTPGATPTTFLVSGGQVAWESGYTFRVSAASYYLDAVLLASAEDTVSLATPHATLDRLDVIALDAAGDVVVIAGTPSATPSEPTVDPAAYLKLAIVFVTHATSEPPDLDTITVYTENAGAPSEWAWSSSHASIVLNSTTTPHAGTTAIEGTNVVAGAYAQGTAAAAFDPTGYDQLLLFIRSKAAWNNSRGLLVTLRAAGVLVGAAVQIRRSGTFGFDSTNTSGYQMVAIPIVAFAVPAGTLVDQVRLEDFGGAIGFYLDDLSFQVGATTGGGGGGGLSQEQADARYAPLVHASRHAPGGADALAQTRTMTVVFGTGSAAITAGQRTYVSCPYTGTITGARVLAVDPSVTSGSIVIDVWKDTYANYPPVVGDSITASAKPTLSSATKSEDTTLTGWTTAVTAGDVFGFTVESASTVTQVALQLTLVVS